MSTSILATKLYIPTPRDRAVLRPHLIEQLTEGLHGKLTLISASAGFGKTTLVSEWVAGCERQSAWLSLDEEDNDLTRFLTYLVAALQTVIPTIDDDLLAALQSPQPPPTESILTSLLNEISNAENHFIFVLDDYHIIDNKQIDETLTFLLDHLPPQMHLVITTREDPSLPLSRLRVRDQLTELRAADLRFMPAETAGFLNQMMGLNLSDEDITALETRTEGWIAGLQLAAISIKGQKDTDKFIQSFTGSHRFVLDYLIEEVMEQQPENVQTFLLETSILSRLSGPLCDAVTSQDNGKETLEILDRSNLFVVALDNDRRWYRYHHLFADVLLARLMEKKSNLIPTLQQRASKWYEQNDSPSDAIHHALAAKDFDRTADLLEKVWPAMDQTFQTNTWLGWAKALPDDLVRTRPVLSVDFAWTFLNQGELDAAKYRLKDAEKWLETPSTEQHQKMVVVDEDRFHSLSASIASARTYIAMALGDVPNTLIYAQQALDLLPEDAYLKRGPAASLLGLAYWASGNLEEAHQALADAMNGFRKSGNLIFAISGTYGLADIRVAQGQLREAISIYERSLQLALEQGEPAIPGTADIYLGLSKLFYEQGDVETTKENLSKSEALGEQAALADWPYRLRIAQARIKQSEGDMNSALNLLDEAEQLYFSSPVPETHPISALKTQVWIAQGKLTEALEWAQKRGLSVDGEISYLREFEFITLAKILIAQYKKGQEDEIIHQANILIERLLKAAEDGERVGSVIETLLLQALVYKAQGEISLALEPLERALTLAEPESYLRIFVNEGAPMQELLSEAIAQEIMPDYVNKLLAAFSTKKQKTDSPPEQTLINPLSERELEILTLIAAGLKNKEIAEQLFISLNTVLYHVKNIYNKLGVKKRTLAIIKARELNLI
ncbi:MAG: winged helix-turn-helix transcriptional regulator [Chloroflexi bacterium]|nr:winged helix-turn-helix transcriptional regulator [Chloroflexota bacterium]